MIPAMPRKERHPPAADLRYGHRIGRQPVRGVEKVLFGAVKQRVKSGPADHGDVSKSRHAETLTVSPMAGYGARHAAGIWHGA
jgi:hypothetical protein